MKLKNRAQDAMETMPGMGRNMSPEMGSDLKVGLDRGSNRLIFGATIGSILLSLFAVRKNAPLGNFIGLWAPTILALAILLKENKILDIERRRLGYGS